MLFCFQIYIFKYSVFDISIFQSVALYLLCYAVLISNLYFQVLDFRYLDFPIRCTLPTLLRCFDFKFIDYRFKVFNVIARWHKCLFSTPMSTELYYEPHSVCLAFASCCYGLVGFFIFTCEFTLLKKTVEKKGLFLVKK